MRPSATSTHTLVPALRHSVDRAVFGPQVAGCERKRIPRAWPPPHLRQYLYFCTSKASKLRERIPRERIPRAWPPPHLRQYLYFCTSKASKLRERIPRAWPPPHLCQYLYFCTSKASKLSTLLHDCRHRHSKHPPLVA
jgi:ribosomal protein L24E